MTTPPEDDDDRHAANLGGLIAVVAIVVLSVWLLIAFRHSSQTLDCEAAGHRDCSRYQ